MARKNAATTVTYAAWDTAANGYKTGDVANHTLRVVADGVVGTIAATPTEPDATNAPGRYKVVIAAGENTGTHMRITGKSSTASIVLVDTTWENEIAADVTLVEAADATDYFGGLVGTIGSGTGAAMNFAPTTDNESGPLKGVSAVGTQTAGTYASVAAEDGSRHQITHAGNAIDRVYKFSVGAGRNVAKVVWKGYLTSSNDTITVQAYNGSTWDTRKTITGVNTTTNVTQDIDLLSTHTLTGAEAGDVYLRFVCSGMTSPVLNTDSLLAQAQNLGQTVGYALGSIWVKATGTSGTTPYVHGTGDNPCPWADAVTLNGVLGLNRYVITPGTTVTLGAALAGAVMSGRSYSLALGGQNVSGTFFEGVESLSGTGTCATAEAIFMDCHVNAVTIGEADFVRCHLMGAITMSQASVPYRFHDCTGITTAKIVFAAANQSAVVSRVSGVLTIAGMVGTNTLYIDGDGDVTLDATNTGGTVYIAGSIRLTNLGSGQTVTDSARWDEGQSVAAVTALTTQAIRDAMKLAPTAGDPADGSVDKHLDDIPTTAAPTVAQIDTQLSGTHGAGAWGGGAGSGSVEWAYVVTDDNEDPIPDAFVYVTAHNSAILLASGYTDETGTVVFMLDAGEYDFYTRKGGYNFTNPDQETVS